MTKEFSFDNTYHTKEQCLSNKDLINHSKNLSTLCSTIDDFSDRLKQIKEDRKDISREIQETIKEEKKKHVKAEILPELTIKDKTYEDRVKTENIKIELSKIPILGKIGSSFIGGPDAAGMLNISENKNIPVYTKDAIKLDGIGDLKFNTFNNGVLSKWKYNIGIKIENQFKDFNYKAGDVEGYIFKNNSASVKRIKESEEFKKTLKENRNILSSGKNFSNGFTKSKNLAKAFGKVDFLNDGFDKKGNLHLYMFDTYDFNPNEEPLVEAGRRQMMKRKLKPFLLYTK